MKFFYFIAHENHHFSIAYKNSGEGELDIKRHNIDMPLCPIVTTGYSYSFNSCYNMGRDGCNHKGYGINERVGKPNRFETTFRDALIETFL